MTKDNQIIINGTKCRVWTDRKGYPVVYYRGSPQRLHRLAWELENGALPDGIDLHHKDFDKANWHTDNLLPLTRQQHYQLHLALRREQKAQQQLSEGKTEPC